MVAQVAAVEQVHDQVQVVAVLEGVVHVDQERTVQLREDLALVHDRLDAALGEDARLAHFLHGVVGLELLALDLPHLAEAALADAVQVLERRLAHS